MNTITSLHKGPFGRQYLFADLTKDQEAYGYRLPSEVQAQQLAAIHQHNEKLPPRKKKKEALSELPSVNVYCKVGTQLEKVKKKGAKADDKKKDANRLAMKAKYANPLTQPFKLRHQPPV